MTEETAYGLPIPSCEELVALRERRKKTVKELEAFMKARQERRVEKQ